MERWAGRVALVTGASSGIGAAVVELFAKRGMKVIGCARRVERIQVSTCIPKFAKVLVHKRFVLCLQLIDMLHQLSLCCTYGIDYCA